MPRALAGAPGTAAVVVVPADGRHRGVQLRAQTVDVTIAQDATGVWADTRLWVQLHNPSAKPIVVTIALPGPQANPVALPSDLEATLDNKPLTLTPLPAQPDQPAIGFTAPITVPLRGMAAVLVRYRQALPEDQGLVTFNYPLTTTAIWSGRPESLRVTVRFAHAAEPDQLLAHAPAATRYHRDGMTWHWENTKATSAIGVAFMAPDWWAAFRNEGAAAAIPTAGLAEYMALARRYRQLAALPEPAFASDVGFFDRYYPPAVAALEAGVAAAGADTDPAALAQAYADLAALYQQRADRLPEAAAAPFIQMAALALEHGVALTPTDAELRRAAAALYAQLADQAQARGAGPTA